MGQGTKIEWADHTWNPWWGCTKVSVGDKGACEFCYAEPLAHRFGVGWGSHALRRKAGPKHWALPARWQRMAQRKNERPFVFCASMADIFDNQVPAEWRAEAFQVMRDCPNLVWLLLTKRPSQIMKLAHEAGGLPPNAALGCSVVTQAEAARDIPWLIAAAGDCGPLFSFISCEPLMEALNLRDLGVGGLPYDALRRNFLTGSISWVIAGGESGPKARPSHPDWFRSLRDQCAEARVPFLFKQWGEWAPHDAWRVPPQMKQEPGWPTIYRVGKQHAGRTLDGVEHNGFPEGFQRLKAAA